jgi:hypothetical protein
LAILKRIDDLESLIQTTVVSVPSVPEPTIFPSTSPFAPHEDLNVLLESTQWKPCLVNVEAILEWPVFEAIEQHRHWSFPAEEENDHSPLSISVEFDIQSSSHLIERFFEDIHIFNPILEENDVRDYMRNIQLNGIGWDSKSCLMVKIPIFITPSVSSAHAVLAFNLCSRLNLHPICAKQPRNTALRVPPIAQFSSRRVVFPCCTEAAGHDVGQKWGCGGAVLLSCRGVLDDNIEANISVEDVRAGLGLLSGPSKPQHGLCPLRS